MITIKYIENNEIASFSQHSVYLNALSQYRADIKMFEMMSVIYIFDLLKDLLASAEH